MGDIALARLCGTSCFCLSPCWPRSSVLPRVSTAMGIRPHSAQVLGKSLLATAFFTTRTPGIALRVERTGQVRSGGDRAGRFLRGGDRRGHGDRVVRHRRQPSASCQGTPQSGRLTGATARPDAQNCPDFHHATYAEMMAASRFGGPRICAAVRRNPAHVGTIPESRKDRFLALS